MTTVRKTVSSKQSWMKTVNLCEIKPNKTYWTGEIFNTWKYVYDCLWTSCYLLDQVVNQTCQQSDEEPVGRKLKWIHCKRTNLSGSIATLPAPHQALKPRASPVWATTNHKHTSRRQAGLLWIIVRSVWQATRKNHRSSKEQADIGWILQVLFFL